MKIVTWNINGIRSGKDMLGQFLRDYSPDIVCLQEVKLDPDKRQALGGFGGYNDYYYFAQKKGYSGVGFLAKKELMDVKRGTEKKIFDDEARSMVTKLNGINIANHYFPHSRRGLTRLGFKLDYNKEFTKSIKLLPKDRTIICGDLNVAHEDIDIARPRDNRKNAGFTDVERKWMTKFLKTGWLDVFRELYPNKQLFTYWSNMHNARSRNIGWRIDYFLVSAKMFKRVRSCRILTKVKGSDHCPVLLDIK